MMKSLMKQFKAIVLFTICNLILWSFFIPIRCDAQYKFELKFKFEDWGKDSWKGWDKQIHCLGGFVLNNQLDKYNPWWKSFLIGQSISIAYEIKDGFLPWGFSWKDHIAFTIGQLGQGLFDYILFKETIYNNKDLKKIIKKRLNKKLYIQK